MEKTRDQFVAEVFVLSRADCSVPYLAIVGPTFEAELLAAHSLGFTIAGILGYTPDGDVTVKVVAHEDPHAVFCLAYATGPFRVLAEMKVGSSIDALERLYSLEDHRA